LPQEKEKREFSLRLSDVLIIGIQPLHSLTRIKKSITSVLHQRKRQLDGVLLSSQIVEYVRVSPLFPIFTPVRSVGTERHPAWNVAQCANGRTRIVR
jgi:hypothetical protein